VSSCLGPTFAAPRCLKLGRRGGKGRRHRARVCACKRPESCSGLGGGIIFNNPTNSTTVNTLARPDRSHRFSTSVRHPSPTPARYSRPERLYGQLIDPSSSPQLSRQPLSDCESSDNHPLRIRECQTAGNTTTTPPQSDPRPTPPTRSPIHIHPQKITAAWYRNPHHSPTWRGSSATGARMPSTRLSTTRPSSLATSCWP